MSYIPTKEDMAAEVEAGDKYFDGFSELDENPRDCFAAGFYRGCAYALAKFELMLKKSLAVNISESPAKTAEILKDLGIQDVTIAQIAIWRKEAQP